MAASRNHKFTAGDGSVRHYYTVLEEEHCPVCNPHGMRENGVLGVISHDQQATVLECLNCAHTVTMDARLINHKYPQVKQAIVEAEDTV